MNTKEIEYIMAVAEEGNITRAAQRLYIAQPSLSQCIHKIETQLGAKLFIRTNSGLTLTYAGELFLASASKILKIYRDLENNIFDINTMKSGRLVVGTPFLLGSQVLPLIYPIYRSKYPNIQIQLIEEGALSLEHSLINGKIDLAILPLPLNLSNIQYEILSVCKMVICVPPHSELLAYVNPEDNTFDIRVLNDQPFILGHPEQRIRQVADAILKEANVSVKTVLLTRSVETAARLSSNGLGFAILPESYIKHYSSIPQTNYFYIPAKYPTQWTVVAAYLNNTYLSLAAQKFISELKASYKSIT